jgi:hypothetical protein
VTIFQYLHLVIDYTCTFSDPTLKKTIHQNVINGGDWLHVRHVNSTHGSMHPATDSLAGTEEYGVPNSNEAWTIKFHDLTYDQMLFASGDWSLWGRMNVSEI